MTGSLATKGMTSLYLISGKTAKFFKIAPSSGSGPSPAGKSRFPKAPCPSETRAGKGPGFPRAAFGNSRKSAPSFGRGPAFGVFGMTIFVRGGRRAASSRRLPPRLPNKGNAGFRKMTRASRGSVGKGKIPRPIFARFSESRETRRNGKRNGKEPAKAPTRPAVDDETANVGGAPANSSQFGIFSIFSLNNA
jgi:hypothetical protein